MGKKSQYALLIALLTGVVTFFLKMICNPLCLLIALLTGVVTLTSATAKGQKKVTKKVVVANPLLRPSGLPYGAPNFKVIKETDYLPAFEAGIKQARAEISAIVSNKQTPTFANTILALEKSGLVLDRVQNIFFCITEADKTPGIAAAEEKIVPMLTDWENEVSFNQKLFKRIKYVYDHELSKLQGEDKKLTEEVYKGFVRSGALLSPEKKTRMQAINKRIAALQTEFGVLIPKATNAATVWVQSESELAGLSAASIAQCKKDAEALGGKAPYCIVITNTTGQPILTNLENRNLRKRVFEASVHRVDGTNEKNSFPLVAEIAKLRAEKAKLMGYNNAANYSLSNTMAQNTDNVYSFLNSLIKVYRPKADAESREIEQYAQSKAGADFKLQPYDRFFYAAKMKKEKFSFSDDEVKPYFTLDSVLVNGVFYAAHRAYGLSFRERFDLPTYHKDMKVFDVLDSTGKQLALFYADYFRRPTKRGGAWMSAFAKQSGLRKQIPVIYNVMNIAKAPEGQPTLLTWDETTTLFHEFGHALHGMLSNCKYNTLSGTAVARDFVEMPSQFNESFAPIPEVLDHYAKHYKTGETLPAVLKEKMLSSMNYLSAYSLGENLAATCLDMAWHTLAVDQVPNADEAKAFEQKALSAVGLLDIQIPPRYSTSYFNHIWGGGYAAGYYSYLWTEVLAENIAATFKERGALKRSTGDDFRTKILSRGNTLPLMQIFTNFTGLTSPRTEDLLKARGM